MTADPKEAPPRPPHDVKEASEVLDSEGRPIARLRKPSPHRPFGGGGGSEGGPRAFVWQSAQTGIHLFPRSPLQLILFAPLLMVFAVIGIAVFILVGFLSIIMGSVIGIRRLFGGGR